MKEERENVKLVKFGRMCPLCKKFSYVMLTLTEVEQFQAYQVGNEPIQNVMPDTDAAVREYLKGFVTYDGGYCHDCMKKMFGNTSSRIQDKNGGKTNE